MSWATVTILGCSGVLHFAGQCLCMFFQRMDRKMQLFISWFQTFTVIWTLIFFWVFPRRQIVVGRRFRTLYQFHLQRLGVQCTHCTPSLWRWNWYRVPKRRPTTIWRWGNTQKKIYKAIYLFNFFYFYFYFLKDLVSDVRHIICGIQ